MASVLTQTLQNYNRNMAMASNQGVATVNPEYAKQLDKWERCRDVVAGTDAVKMAGTKYLPLLDEQPTQEYVQMVNRANFYNASARTISGLLGMLFRKPPTRDIPPGVEDYLKDVSQDNTPFDMFAKIAAREVLTVYRVGILTDFPQGDDPDGEGEPEVLTLAAAEAKNLRPILKMYYAENIINWKHALVNNVNTLTQVVLLEQVTIAKLDAAGKPSEFETEVEKHYRVLDIFNGSYRVRVFKRENGKDVQIGNDKFPKMNSANMTYIPFYPITPDGISWELDNPPLLDLIDVNLSHYRTSADYEHGCHFVGVPTPMIFGADAPTTADGKPTKVYLGAKTLLFIPNAEADAKYLEFTGSGLGALVSNLDRKESQMAILGARLLAPEGKQVQTATTTAIHRTGENSILSDISISVSIGLTKNLDVFCAWCDKPYACKYQINRDFLPVAVDGPTLTAMVANWQAGGVSDEEMFDWQKRADIIEPDTTFEEHNKGKFQDPLAAAKLTANTAIKTAATKPPKAASNKTKKTAVQTNPNNT